MASPWERFLGRPPATTMVEETSVGVGGALRRCVLTASSSPWMEVIGILLGLGTGWYLRRRGLKAEREQQQQRRQLQQAASLAHPQEMLTDCAPRTPTAVAAIVPVGGSLVVAGDGRRRRRRGAGRGAPADGEAAGEGRSSLSERLARGVPVLGATLLWQLLMKIDGPPSLLDPLAAVLSWFFLELIMVSVPRVVWKKWDMGNPEEAGRGGVAAGPGAHVPHLMLGTVREAEEGTLGEEGKDEAVPLSRENRDTGAAMLPPSSPPILPFDGHQGRGRGGGGGGGANGSARATPAAVHGFEEVAPVTPYAAAMSEPGPRTFVRRRRTAHGTAAARHTVAMAGGGVGGTEAAAAAMAATMAAGGGERGAGQEWRQQQQQQQQQQQLQEPAGQDGAYTHAGSGALTAAEAAPTATAPCTPDEMQAGRGSEGVSTDKNGSSTATAAGLNREKHTRAPDQGSSSVAAAAAASAAAAPARVSPARDGGAARMLKLRPRAFMGDGAAVAGPRTPSKLASGRACLSRAIGSPGAYATPPPPPPPSPSSSIAPRRTGGTTRGAIAKNEPRARPRRQQQQQQHGQAGLKLVDMNTTRVLTPDAAAVGACVGENGVGRGIGKGAASASDGCHGGGVAGTGGDGCRTPASGGGAGSPVKTRSSKRRHPGACYSPRGPSEDEFPAAKRAMLMGVKREPSWDGWGSGSAGGGLFGGSGGGSFGGFGVVDEQQRQRQESEQRIGRQPQQEYQHEMQRQQQERIEDQLRPGDKKEDLQQHQHRTEEQLQQHDGQKKSQQPRPEQRIGRQSQQEYTQEMQRQQQQQQQIESHVRPGEGKEDLQQPQHQHQHQHQTEESVERQPRPANNQKELQLPQQQGPHQEGSPNGQASGASGGAGDVTTDAVADTGAACATETGERSIAAETRATRTTTTKTATAEAATSSAIRDGLASSAKDLSIPSTSSFSSFTVATKATFSSSSSSSSCSPSSTTSSSATETPPAAPIPALAPSAPANAPGGPRRGSEGNENGREGGVQRKAEVGPGPVPATVAAPGVAARTPVAEAPAAAAAATVEAGAAAVSASSETPEGSEAPAALGWRERGTLLSLDASLTSGGGGGGRGDGDGRDGPEESGTPVPPELRPPGREVDVLWEWRLEQLRVDDEVGMFSRGSFGKVVAVRTEMDQQMAVKIVAKSAMSPERYIERELELLEACSVHPNVVGLHGVIRTSERVYVLMPLADTDLAAMVKSTVLDEKQAAFCVRQVVSAVEFLHKRGIVHRDVKPANILVLSNKVLLADFGLAKQLPRVNGRTGLLVGACGTKPYLAPELVRDVPYDAAVDLWALGVVTYELLHGYTPFSPKLVTPRSWDGVVREDYAPRINSDRHGGGGGGGGGGGTNSLSSNIRAYPGDSNVEGFCLSVDNRSSTLSVSESSGSIVTNNRMFERSAPPAAGGGPADGAAAGRRGLDRAWLVGQAHQALLFGKGAENDEYREERRTSGGGVSGGGDAGGGQGRGGVRRRRGHREADQLKLLDAIVRGDYEVEKSRVGGVCAGFISQLLETCPGRRMSAAVAAEHPFLGPVSKVAPRRRAARAEAAAVQTERAANAAERCKARILQQQQQQQGLGRSSALAAAATAEAAAALTNIATLAGAMSAEARSLLADAKRWDKAAAEAEAAAAAAAAGGDWCSGGVDGGPGLAAVEAGAAAEEAAEKAESAVRRAELLARESRAGCAAAEAVARSRELAEEQERAAGLPAARKECASNGAAVVERSKGGSGDLVPRVSGGGGGGGGVGSGVGSVGDGGGVEGGLSTGNGSVSTVAGEQRQ